MYRVVEKVSKDPQEEKDKYGDKAAHHSPETTVVSFSD